MKTSRLAALLPFLAACASAPAPTAPAVVHIHCGKLIDGEAGAARGPTDLVVKDGRIERMGDALPVPPGAGRIDLGADTCVPGLIDMHTHLTAAPEDEANLPGHFATSREGILERARKNAKTTLLAGFTTVRDVGAYHGWANRDLRDQINRGDAPGPRMQFAPFYLTMPHGGGDAFLPGGDDAKIRPELRLGVAHGPAEYRAKAQLAVDGGADLLKIIASGAVLSPGSIPGDSEMTAEEIQAVVDVAHHAGLKVAAHAHGTKAILDCLRAGVDTIEHASLIDAEGIRLAKAKHAALDMDIYKTDYIDTVGRKEHWPDEFLVKNRKVGYEQRRNFTKAYRAGVALIFGTDSGVYPHGDNAKQFRVMVAQGMKPMDAIRAATSVSAHYMGWDKDVGTLAPGYYADLVAVAGDPLRDIAVLEHPVSVVKGGAVVSR